MKKEKLHWACKLKEYERGFYKIALVLFLLSIVGGFVWLSGYNAEPTTFLLSFVSSTFFALPHLFKYFCPDPKLIKDMSKDEILNYIIDTDSNKDWSDLVDEKQERHEFFLNNDVGLRIVFGWSKDYIQNENFIEGWANEFPDQHAVGYYCRIYYGSGLIYKMIIVAVDGHRAYLPVPKSPQNKLVKNIDYKIAEIINCDRDKFVNYFKRAGLDVEFE